jgi:Ulp1 family protease
LFLTPKVIQQYIKDKKIDAIKFLEDLFTIDETDDNIKQEQLQKTISLIEIYQIALKKLLLATGEWLNHEVIDVFGLLIHKYQNKKQKLNNHIIPIS